MREEEGYGERAGEVATELAHHYSRANDKNKAIHYFQLAGERAVARGAVVEAEESYRQALAALNTRHPSPERDGRELELMGALFHLLTITRGYTAPDTRAAATHTRSLAEKSRDLAQFAVQEYATWAAVYASGDLSSAGRLADDMVELAGRREGHHISLAFAHSAQVGMCFARGDLMGVENHFARLDRLIGAVGISEFPGAIILPVSWAGLGAWFMGHPRRAFERIARAIALATDKKSPYDLAYGRFFQGWLWRWLREPQSAEAAATQALVVAELHGFRISKISPASCKAGRERNSAARRKVSR